MQPTKGSPTCKGNHDHLDPNCKECATINHKEASRCHFNTWNRQTPMSAIRYTMQHKFGGQVQVQRRKHP